MLAKPQGFPRKLGGCAGLDPRLRSAVSAGVGDGERGLRRGLRAPGVGVRPKWVLEYSPSNKRIRYFVSITYVRTGLWTAHKFCGGGKKSYPASESSLSRNYRLTGCVPETLRRCRLPFGGDDPATIGVGLGSLFPLRVSTLRREVTS